MWLVKLFSFSVLVPALASYTPLGPRRTPINVSDTDVTLTSGIAWRTIAGNVPIRREIHDLKDKFPDQWNIYLLGLRALQLEDHTSPTSYYQIAGIHGRPLKVWEGAMGRSDHTPGQYCPHSNTMFLGWHRAYLALYEQELYKHMRDVASQFPPNLVQKYTTAVEDFRIPYWDWGLGSSGPDVPDMFTAPTVQVVGTNGSSQTIANPLHHFDFPDIISNDFERQWVNFNSTLRWPSSDMANATTQDDRFIANFKTNRQFYHDQLSGHLAFAGSMNEFSKVRLEPLHGNIHYTIGGAPPPADQSDGHMWPTDYSAFEPTFWLHHCNVDRIFAIWQALRPSSYFEPDNVGTAENSWIVQSQTVDAETPLLPFWNTPSSYWTTNGVRNTTVLGYAYPETQRWNYPSDDAYRRAVNKTVSSLYSSSVRKSLTGETGQAGGVFGHILDQESAYTDWTIFTEGSRADFTASFYVRFSLIGVESANGTPEVGSWVVILPSPNKDSGSASTKRESSTDLGFKGTVSLTASLLDQIAAGNLSSLDAGDVVPFLTNKLTWEVYMGGKLVPSTNVPSLAVQVTSSTVQIPDDSDTPMVYKDELVAHSDITSGKSGNANP
ncbi:Di-copper centre-containing protein [Lophiostoma macrostomum CBS 122681]|uniref:tyrosinase n=1 Tax=Lophiostoma macrostomum CBS 122681 TaxID=1314788 RepID=A0A6A6TV45_9PLEO|nr:Di-copper centre-containing protein [Lophiostoma macrostomum CBS 122681]